MAGPDLAVLVVNWNVRDLVIGCLQAAQHAAAQGGLSTTFWVVDNNSQDGSVEALRSRLGDVRVLASPVNLGFGGGNNLGLRAMGFDGVAIEASAAGLVAESHERGWTGDLPRYVLFLNPDTAVQAEAIDTLVRFADAHPLVGVCGPGLVYGDGRFQHAAYRFPSLAQILLDFWPTNWRLTESRLNGRYPRKAYDSGQPFPIDHPLGAAMLFRRPVIEETGGFDPSYHMYVEEIDWCMRVKRAGWQIYCVPAATVIHHHGQSTRQVQPQMKVALWRSRFTLYRKTYSASFQWAARCIVKIGMRTEIRRTEKAQARGEIDEQAARALVAAYQEIASM